METVFLLDRVMQDLEQHPNLMRIKKLTICACRKTWENDPTYLDSLALGPLIQELVSLHPTLEQLKQSLTGVVRTVNKTAEYTLVANIILETVKPLYPEAKQFEDDEQVYVAQLYRDIAQDLEQDENSERMKKLIFSACGHLWENDIRKVDGFQLSTLIQTLHELNPTLHDLYTTLSKVVSTLNKQTEYSLIADDILDRLERLYPDDFSSTEVILNDEPPLTASTQSAAPMSPSVALSSFPLAETGRSSVSPAPSAPEVTPQPPSLEYDLDLFDIRLEAIRYANPLRVKILAFAVLYHPFAFSKQDWLDLHAHQLDDLLQQLFFACETPAVLEAKLDEAAQTFDDVDEYFQTTAAILQALQSFYPNQIAG